MKSIAYISILAFSLACQSKKETTQKEASIDTVATASSPNVDKSEVFLSFGFSNENGSKILAFEENVEAGNLTQTIDNEGKITPIKFETSQKGNENGVNLVPTNFKNCAGKVFSVVSKNVSNDLSCVIFNDAFLRTHSLVTLSTLAQPTKIDEVNKNKIATERKRKIKEAWKVADLGNESAYIVIFEPKKDSVLASLVIGGTSYIYRDYPAKYDEGSTWRVDDGGEFPNDAIKILAVFRNQAGELEIITEWAGAEGANIEYAKANKNKFETIKEASRYWGAL
ncbi:hypothetical protein GCM10027035_13520 [Emticicia sediminis]